MKEDRKKKADELDRRLTELENRMSNHNAQLSEQEIKPKRGRVYGDPVAEIEW